MRRAGLFVNLAALAGSGLLFQSARGEAATNRFSFDDFLLVPIRVHLLLAKDAPDIQTTLTESDVTRILGKMNGVWAQAGLHLFLESLVREEANVQETATESSRRTDSRSLLAVRPSESKATNAFNIYYLKRMSVNGFFSEAIFVKDTASLRKVEGGIDEPIPRVSSHELGHALSLPHRQDITNLMASGTTGIWLNDQEIKQAREAARRFDWVESAPALVEKANALFRGGKTQEAANLYSRLATMPLKVDQVDLAGKRAAMRGSENSPRPSQLHEPP
jgi:hypothetical protein